jgi:hypothetical protein
VLQGRPARTVEEDTLSREEKRKRAVAIMASDQNLQNLSRPLNAALRLWATREGKTIDPNDDQYAYDLHEFAYILTHVPQSSDLKPRPKHKKAIRRWKRELQQAYLLSLMIFSSGANVNVRERMAALIAVYLAQQGLSNEAMELAALLSDSEEKKSVYEKVLEVPGNATAKHLRTVLQYFAQENATLVGDNPLVEKLGFLRGRIKIDGDEIERLLPNNTRQFIQSLSNATGTRAAKNERHEKLRVIFDVLINSYGGDLELVNMIASILFFIHSFRQEFSEWMWHDGKEYFLFNVLTSLEFTEPDYGNPHGKPPFVGVPFTMNRDMPWVYKNKQRYFMNYLVHLCEKAGTPIPRLERPRFAQIRNWLDTYTETIGKSMAKVYPNDTDKLIWGYEQITDIFFYHVERGDVTPNRSGRIRHLRSSAPSMLRIRADCDVFATYGVRLMRQCGFTAIGYMSVLPIRHKFQVGHSGALLKREETYFEVNNKQVLELDAESETQALIQLRDGLLDVLEKPAMYRVYYEAVGPDGIMTENIANTSEDARRTDLEP